MKNENTVVLLGDSIFDNQPYVGKGGFPVASYLQKELGNDFHVELIARDGAVIQNVFEQIGKVPPSARHMFLSVGGNNITRHLDYLSQSAKSVAEVLLEFGRLSTDFKEEYELLLKHLKHLGISLTICTIYNCHFQDQTERACVEVALRLFNDVIIQTAYSYKVPYIDLRHVAMEASDFVYDIEPSDSGGKKIAEALAAYLKGISSA